MMINKILELIHKLIKTNNYRWFVRVQNELSSVSCPILISFDRFLNTIFCFQVGLKKNFNIEKLTIEVLSINLSARKEWLTFAIAVLSALKAFPTWVFSSLLNPIELSTGWSISLHCTVVLSPTLISFHNKLIIDYAWTSTIVTINITLHIYRFYGDYYY